MVFFGKCKYLHSIYIYILCSIYIQDSIGYLLGAHFSKNSISLKQIEIFQFCLKYDICGDSPSHGWLGIWVDGWVIRWGQVESLKIKTKGNNPMF